MFTEQEIKDIKQEIKTIKEKEFGNAERTELFLDFLESKGFEKNEDLATGINWLGESPEEVFPHLNYIDEESAE